MIRVGAGVPAQTRRDVGGTPRGNVLRAALAEAAVRGTAAVWVGLVLPQPDPDQTSVARSDENETDLPKYD